MTTEPAYGETPGTEAYRKREGDARPDEIAVIPEELSDLSPAERSSSDSTALDVPKTVVIESAGTIGPHSPEFEERLREDKKADATPDVVLESDEAAEDSASGVDASSNKSGTVVEQPTDVS